MIRLTNEEIVSARIEAYAEEGLPVTDICRYANLEDRGIAKAQLKKVVEWGNEPCPHGVTKHTKAYAKRDCPECWQALLEEVK